MATYQELDFVKDPYNLPDPATIESRYIEWNREDLRDQHVSVQAFVRDAAQGYKTSLLAYGPIGSGKTWLGRVIEKEYLDQQKDGVVLRTRILRFQANFEAVYDTFIESFLSDGRTLQLLDGRLHSQAAWSELFPGNKDLGTALYHIASDDAAADTARNWLRGSSEPAADLKIANISLRITTPLQRYNVIRSLIDKCVELFPSVILIVDELENADPKFAREFGDVLRELVDAFGERFGLCCLFTGESLEDFYDHGYVETLWSRITHKVPLTSVELGAAVGWLKKHQIRYRKASYLGNQMDPFSETGLKRMLELMLPEKMYPRYILTNCGHLARQFTPGSKPIDTSFVENHKARLENLE